MNHRLVPAFVVSSQMAHYAIEQWATKTFSLIDRTQFCSLFLWFMLYLIPFDLDALIKYFFGSTCGEVATKPHRDSSGHHFAKHNKYQVSGYSCTDSHDKHKRSDQAIIESKHNLSEPITPVRVLFIDLLHSS